VPGAAALIRAACRTVGRPALIRLAALTWRAGVSRGCCACLAFRPVSYSAASGP